MGKKLDVPQSGKVGTKVNVNTRYGHIEREYVIPRDPKTPDQVRVRSNLGHIAPRWRELTQEQRDAWTLGGQDEETRHRLGQSAPLNGFQFFMRINCARAALGLDQFVLPPPFSKLGASLVGELLATNDGGEIALKLGSKSSPPPTHLPRYHRSLRDKRLWADSQPPWSIQPVGIMEPSWSYHGTIMVLSWYYHGTPYVVAPCSGIVPGKVVGHPNFSAKWL
jgi:hypothetical protein